MDIQELLDSSDFDPNNHPEKTYEQGWQDGTTDANTIVQNKPNENGHTFEVYAEIRDRLVTAVYNTAPTDWQRGYADAFDEVAIQAQKNDPERWCNQD